MACFPHAMCERHPFLTSDTTLQKKHRIALNGFSKKNKFITMSRREWFQSVVLVCIFTVTWLAMTMMERSLRDEGGSFAASFPIRIAAASRNTFKTLPTRSASLGTTAWAQVRRNEVFSFIQSFLLETFTVHWKIANNCWSSLICIVTLLYVS